MNAHGDTRGFTLIETMAAGFVLAVASVAFAAALSQVIGSRRHRGKSTPRPNSATAVRPGATERNDKGGHLPAGESACRRAAPNESDGRRISRATASIAVTLALIRPQ